MLADSSNHLEKATPILLRQFGEFLATRTLGDDARRLIEQSVHQDGVARIDFAGVDGITISFADEVFGKLVLQWGLDLLRSRIRVRNANEGIARTIQFAISTRLPAISTAPAPARKD